MLVCGHARSESSVTAGLVLFADCCPGQSAKHEATVEVRLPLRFTAADLIAESRAKAGRLLSRIDPLLDQWVFQQRKLYPDRLRTRSGVFRSVSSPRSRKQSKGLARCLYRLPWW